MDESCKGSNELTKIPADNLLKSAIVLDRGGLTKAGRALQKHESPPLQINSESAGSM
jgi:hypothetical protein